MYFGAHLSIRNGVQRALERGRSLACDCVQLFTRNQRRWQPSPLRDEDVHDFHALKSGFRSVYAHASYLINLASPDDLIWSKSIGGLSEDLKRCQILGVPMLVLHPGSHQGQGVARGIERACEALERTYSREGLPGILIETTAGQGTSIGFQFSQLRDILDGTVSKGIPVGVCLDTCHLFAAGYDISTHSGFQSTCKTFDRILGLENLKLIHLNDSKGSLGSRIDRHEHLGRGTIGMTGLSYFVRAPVFRNLAGCLETPKSLPESRHKRVSDSDLYADSLNLAILRKFARTGSGST